MVVARAAQQHPFPALGPGPVKRLQGGGTACCGTQGRETLGVLQYVGGQTECSE